MTDESTTDDQSEPDEQKADFAARAEKIRGIGPRLAGELAEEFADELTADRNGTPDNDVELSADQAGAPANEVNDVVTATEKEKDRWSALRVAATGAVIAGVFGIGAALIPVVVGLLKDDPPPQRPVAVDQETLLELVRMILSGSSAKGSEQHEDDIRSAVERALREAKAGDAQAKEAIEALRRSGDTAKLLAVLEHEADQKLAASVDEDFLDLCREIATVAFLRGDIDAALLRVELVLKARPNDLSALNLRGWIHDLHGEFDAAIRCYESILELATNDKSWQAAALGNLGNVYQMRGELDRAKEKYFEALKIDEKLGDKEGVARHSGNLAVIYMTRGDLDRAEEMLLKTQNINEELGHKWGVASCISNLAVICKTRGDLERAEEMHRKALKICEELGHKQGMAFCFGNLGVVYAARGDLDPAEEMYLRALELSEEIRDKQSMANQYGNLGLIYLIRGNLDRAEKMQFKALKIDEELKNMEGMAITYLNLGGIAEERGDAVKARELWMKARDLFDEIGIPHEVEKAQGWLDGLENGSDGESGG